MKRSTFETPIPTLYFPNYDNYPNEEPMPKRLNKDNEENIMEKYEKYYKVEKDESIIPELIFEDYIPINITKETQKEDKLKQEFDIDNIEIFYEIVQNLGGIWYKRKESFDDVYFNIVYDGYLFSINIDYTEMIVICYPDKLCSNKNFVMIMQLISKQLNLLDEITIYSEPVISNQELNSCYNELDILKPINEQIDNIYKIKNYIESNDETNLYCEFKQEDDIGYKIISKLIDLLTHNLKKYKTFEIIAGIYMILDVFFDTLSNYTVSNELKENIFKLNNNILDNMKNKNIISISKLIKNFE